jgi:hypothetical protein
MNLRRWLTPGIGIKRWLVVAKDQTGAATFNGYRIRVEKYLIPALGRIKLAKLRPLHVQGIYAELVPERDAEHHAHGLPGVRRGRDLRAVEPLLEHVGGEERGPQRREADEPGRVHGGGEGQGVGLDHLVHEDAHEAHPGQAGPGLTGRQEGLAAADVDRQEQEYKKVRQEKEQIHRAAMDAWQKGDVSSALARADMNRTGERPLDRAHAVGDLVETAEYAPVAIKPYRGVGLYPSPQASSHVCAVYGPTCSRNSTPSRWQRLRSRAKAVPEFSSAT